MTTSDAILYQSVVNANGVPVQQLSNLKLSGFITIADSLNTDCGKLYGTFSFSTPTYTLNLYKDILMTELVATASANALGNATIVEANDSGLSGTVHFASFTANDPLLVAVCFLSTDEQLQRSNLESLSDYDATYGFAEWHIRSFNKIKEIVGGRNRSILWNPNYFDTNFINGGLGGLDLSRVLDWTPLKEAAAYYALSLICERQTTEPGSMFCEAAKSSRNMFKAALESNELQFDLAHQRVGDKTRALRTFKISRA